MRLASHTRRQFIQIALTLFESFFAIAQAAVPSNHPQKSHPGLDAAIDKLLAGQSYTETDAILIQMPDLAEDGANVPITITSTLTDVRLISIFSDQNPSPLIAVFNFSSAMEAFVKSRIKMAASGQVIILLRSGNRFYRAEKMVQVARGGCDIQPDQLHH